MVWVLGLLFESEWHMTELCSQGSSQKRQLEKGHKTTTHSPVGNTVSPALEFIGS